MSWGRASENVNKDRRKYCRSVYYREISVQINAVVISEAPEREDSAASPVFGSK